MSARRRLLRLTDAQAPRRSWTAAVVAGQRPVVVIVAGTALAGALAGALGGVVAAVIASWYAGLALRAARRVVVERSVTANRTAALDLISGLAADLRTGAAPAVAVEATRVALGGAGTSPERSLAEIAGGPDLAVRRALSRMSAACDVSERLGAPLADLLDRVEADLRGTERTRAAVVAQTTGARASAALLALLPVVGVGLGYAMGARPGYALLHTPLGAGCALGALLLQCGGLAWTGRLCRAAVERAS
jgi:tight adherence protein B